MISILGHQGGWDEVALVAAPIIVFAGLLWLANRRAQAQLDREDDAAASGDEPGADKDPGDPAP